MVQQTQEDIDRARNIVRDLYGSSMADKASDIFCLTVTGNENRSVVPPFGLESVGASRTLTTPIIELTSDNELSVEEQTAQNTNQIIKNIGKLDISVAERLKIYSALRQARITARREQFFQSASGIIDELEKNLTNLYAIRSESLTAPSSLTQVCWLNKSLRTLSEPSALSEVAADPRIEKIDFPRQLTAELQVTGMTVGATDYRRNHNLTGKGIIIAIIDAEIDLNHPAFQNRVIHKQNFSQESWGNPGRHGTFVAGIVAANDPSKTITGIAPEAKIYNYKVIANSDRSLNADDFGFAQAIEQALQDGVHIANCSFGVGWAFDALGPLPTRDAYACNQAWDLGMVIVKSAGNRGPNDNTLTSPAQADGVIVVGATDRTGNTVQDYSSRGPIGSNRPHLVAPGGSSSDMIVSTMNGIFDKYNIGTSFAAPHVSGLLALLLEKEPHLSPDQLRTRLLDNCTPFSGVSENVQGKGLINLS